MGKSGQGNQRRRGGAAKACCLVSAQARMPLPLEGLGLLWVFWPGRLGIRGTPNGVLGLRLAFGQFYSLGLRTRLSTRLER